MSINIEQFKQMIEQSKGEHAYSMYIPSKKVNMHFKPLTVGMRKTLSKAAFTSSFDNSSEFDIQALSTISACCLDSDLDIYSITYTDYLSLLCQLLHNNIRETISVPLKCGCKTAFDFIVDLPALIESCEVSYDDIIVTQGDYSFICNAPSAIDMIAIKQYVSTEYDIHNQAALLEIQALTEMACIKNIKYKSDVIEGFDAIDFMSKVQLIDSLQCIDLKSENGLLTKIRNASFTDFNNKLNEMVVCPGCHEVLEGVLTYDSFFIL